MKTLFYSLILILSVSIANARQRHPYYGGGYHTSSHGGHYSGGSGSSHKGGHYRNYNTYNTYGTHKRR